jgi:hypothetical protein
MLKLSIPIAAILLTCQRASAQEHDYSVTAVKDTDKATLVVQDQTLRVRIQSASGIGVVKLVSNTSNHEWPSTVELVIVDNAGRALRELEGFSIQGNNFRVTGSRRESGQMTCVRRGENPGEVKKTRKIDVRVKKAAGEMQVVIPGSLLSNESAVRIQWIDYYR